ncbi:hypothetical protein GCM10010378_29810 [Streptomyces viridochromogenes]
MQAAPADAADARPVRASRSAKTVPVLTSGGALDAVAAVGYHDRNGFAGMRVSGMFGAA